MAKTLIALVVVLLVALGLQIVGVVSMPVTKTISIASYDGHRFGLWGYCDSNGGSCTDIALGYPSDEALPNASMSVLSKLLIVHVVAAGCTLIMLLLVFIGFCGNRKYILALSLLAVISFLVSLLAFLAEILLFTRHLDFAGWFVLASVVLNGIVIVLLCLQHRHLGDKWKGSSVSSEGDDEKLINTKVYQESVDTTNHSDVFEPKRHNDRTFNSAPIAEANERNEFERPIHSQGSGSVPTQPVPQPPRYGQPRYGQSQAPNQLLNDPQQSSRNPNQSGSYQQGGAYGAAGARKRGPNGSQGNYGPRGNSQRGPMHGQGPNQGRMGAPNPAPAPPAHQSSAAARPAPVRKDTEFQNRAKPTRGNDGFDFGGAVPPAGADIPGMEDARSSFGPSVVPVPRVRKIDASQLNDGEEARAGTTPTGTPHMVRAVPRDESRVGIVQYAAGPDRQAASSNHRNMSQGPGTVNDPAAAYRELIPNEPLSHAQVGDSPQHQRHQRQAQMMPPQQGPESNRLMERFIQELPPSQEYFDYSSEQDHLPPAPHSPGGSDFTSVSQRVEHGANQRGSTGFAPAQRRAADRNDMVLNANPDFALPGPRGGRRGRGRGGFR